MANTKVTTNVIADDAITLDKMAGLARGKIIYGDSSGNPAALAVGSNGQVLKSDGTDISWGTDSSNDRDGAAVFNESGAAVDFRIEGDTEQNLFFVDGSADKIGIGTSSPSANLHIYSTSDNAPHLLLENYQNADTDDAPVIELYLNDETTGGIGDNTDVGVIRFTGDEKDGGSKETYAEIRGVAHDPGQGASNKGNLSFFVQAAGDLNETLTLDEKNVGIGTASPSQLLHISSTGSAGILLEADSDNDNEDHVGEIQITQDGGATYHKIGTNNSNNGYVNFSENLVWQRQGTEKMRLTSADQFLVGAAAAVDGERAAISKEGTCKLLIHCTENSSARDAVLSLHTVNGGSQNRINFLDGAGAGSGQGQFYYNHDGNTMYWITGATENMTLDSSGNLTIQGSYSPSDGRLKENIEDFSYDIEKFKAYSPKTFDWINPEEHGGRTQQIGFIAQEQEVIDPRFIEEVETDADRKDTLLLDQITKLDGDVKGISKTSEFVQKDAMYISVIQQLITRLEAAEAKITALEG